jgi:hypothetical protein
MEDELYFVVKIKKHKEIKDRILKSIEKFVQKNPIVDEFSNISNTDWNIPLNVRREWFEIFMGSSREDINLAYEKLYSGFEVKDFMIHNVWFQQYESNSHHGWHTHGGCNFSNVYYLELPEGSQGTEFKFNDKTTFADVEEGDLVIFPAHIPHRSINLSNNRRTVLVFNSSLQV